MTHLYKNFSALILAVLALACSSNKNMGKVTYGENGKIIGGSSITHCTPPTKRYAKNLEAKVNTSFDSLSMVPRAVLDASVQQTVTRLSDYSSEGLDLDLVMFRICEMANNRGLSSDEINSLFKIATDAWSKKGQSSNGDNSGLNSGIIGGQSNSLQSHIVNGANYGVNGDVNINKGHKLSQADRDNLRQWIYIWATDTTHKRVNAANVYLEEGASSKDVANEIYAFLKDSVKFSFVQQGGFLKSYPTTGIHPVTNKERFEVEVGNL